MPSTKLQYLGRIKEQLHQRFPKHEEWATEKSWYSNLLDSTSKAAERILRDDPDYNNPKIVPLYPIVKEGYYGTDINGGKQCAFDMKLLSLRLLQKCSKSKIESLSNGPLQQRVWFLLMMYAVGRGGEIKGLKVEETQWDPWAWNIDLNWNEDKTLTRHSMLFGPSKHIYLLCVYHAFACFFAVERGLYRSPDTIERKFHKYFFPDLHLIANSSVAAKLTSILKSMVPPDMRSNVSSRSTRKGATTFLSMHAGVTESELNARGGWSDTTNSKSYRQLTPALTVPGDAALNQWQDTRTPKAAPYLRAIAKSFHPLIDNLLARLYVISKSLPEFQKGGHLRPFLEACTASLIMYHFDLVDDHGAHHAVAQRLLEAVAEVLPQSEPQVILRAWSTAIRNDFATRNPDLGELSATGGHVRDLIREQNALTRALLERIASTTAVI
jgi:hypothetical protein